MNNFVGEAIVQWAGVRSVSFAPFLDDDRFGLLAHEFPARGFQWTSKAGGAQDKGYSSHNLMLIRNSRLVASNALQLTAAWKELLAWMNGSAYRRAIGAYFGINLDSSMLELRAVRHGEGGWIDPHTDRADKLLTQLIYFNEDWQEDWGGTLLLLGSAAASDVRLRYVPLPNRSIAFQPSTTSWHAIEPVTAPSGKTRRSLLLHFTAQESD